MSNHVKLEEKRREESMKTMSLDEKIAYLKGYSDCLELEPERIKFLFKDFKPKEVA